MIEQRFLRALRKIHSRLKTTGVNWAVTGSLGLSLRGMGVTVNDIDLQTDKEGAYQIGHRLAEYVVEPVGCVESQRLRSHLGRLKIEGILVEIIGDLQKRLTDGTWEEPVSVERYKQWVEFDGRQIPVLSLEYEYGAYKAMGRNEKAEVLRKWLEKSKAGRG